MQIFKEIFKEIYGLLSSARNLFWNWKLTIWTLYMARKKVILEVKGMGTSWNQQQGLGLMTNKKVGYWYKEQELNTRML